MASTMFNGKKVEFCVSGRHSDDIQVEEVFYVDTEVELSESEIEKFQDACAEDIHEAWVDKQVGIAEAWADAQQDR